jgi:hypothetical protein
VRTCSLERLRSKLAADLHDNIGSGFDGDFNFKRSDFKKINPAESGVKKV